MRSSPSNDPHAVSTAFSNSSSNVAICFSGWLGVIVPSRGYSARIGLVEALKADVFVAGFYRANDCAKSVNCTNFLWSRISRLGPPDFDCFEVGERSLIGNGVAMYAHNFGSGALSFKPVTVGKDVRIFG